MNTSPQPTTIEELIEQNGLDGTHSILDITAIADEADFGIAAPLSHEELHDVFATVYPTREMIRDRQYRILGLRSRWQGTYIVAYENDAPAWIYFGGFSGD